MRLRACDILTGMTYQEALRYILSFTDFERLPPAYWSREFDLRRMDEFLDRLADPHKTARSVLIAGSKGKGSTAAMIASALRAAGYHTGLYTSPHLHTFRERIRVNDRLISEEQMAALVERLRPHVEAVNARHAYGELTTFEILTAIAFAYFEDKHVAFQVLEVGLGGRLDATNVVRPEVAVITSISKEHAEVLGDSLQQIAREKAGIIKPGSVVVSSPQRKEAAEAIREVCLDKGVELISIGEDVTWVGVASDLEGQTLDVHGRRGAYRLRIPLLGDHQLENAAAAVAALEVVGVGAGSIARGLGTARWPGRLEVLRRSPVVLVDGAHNADSAQRLKDAIKHSLGFDSAIIVVGLSSDKDVVGIVEELAGVAKVALATRSRHPRALDPAAVLEAFVERGVQGETAAQVGGAVERALELAGPDDLICITGSLFVVAESREHVMGIQGEVYPV